MATQANLTGLLCSSNICKRCSKWVLKKGCGLCGNSTFPTTLCWVYPQAFWTGKVYQVSKINNQYMWLFYYIGDSRWKNTCYGIFLSCFSASQLLTADEWVSPRHIPLQHWCHVSFPAPSPGTEPEPLVNHGDQWWKGDCSFYLVSIVVNDILRLKDSQGLVERLDKSSKSSSFQYWVSAYLVT